MEQAARARAWQTPEAEALLTVSDVATRLAERTGRPVTVAAGVAEATAAWRGGGYAAALADPDSAAALASGGVRAVAVTGPGMVDTAEAALAAGAADVIDADATAGEVEAVLGGPARSAARETSHLHGANLAELSAEAARIAKALESLSQQEPRPESAPMQVTAAYVRGVIRTRRARGHFFKGELFADPAWDILLDLMAARLERKVVSVSSLCIAAAVPSTTALRWIKSMTDEGLLVRKPDPLDGRRVFIDLSNAAAEAMTSYLGQSLRAGAI